MEEKSSGGGGERREREHRFSMVNYLSPPDDYAVDFVINSTAISGPQEMRPSLGQPACK